MTSIMPKVKPEKIAGIVALSYLVLIPAGALYAYKKLQLIEDDVDELWHRAGLGQRPDVKFLETLKANLRRAHRP